MSSKTSGVLSGEPKSVTALIGGPAGAVRTARVVMTKSPKRSSKRGGKLPGDAVELADRIQSAIERKNMTYQDVAVRLNLTRQSVRSWAIGETTPSHTNVKRLCALLDIDVADLYTGLQENIDQDDPVKNHLARDAKFLTLYLGEQEAGGVMTNTLEVTARRKQMFISNPHSSKALAFVVTDAANEPRVPQGSDVAVNPIDGLPDPDSWVFAYCKGQYLLRKYQPAQMGTAVGAKLIAANPSWPDVLMDKDDTVLGVVIEFRERNPRG